MSIEQILSWIEYHYIHTGKYPSMNSGKLLNNSSETWLSGHQTLKGQNKRSDFEIKFEHGLSTFLRTYKGINMKRNIIQAEGNQ